MLNLSTLLRNDKEMEKSLRYSRSSRKSLTGTGEGRGPVVVWNVTRTCNLSCQHCYAGESADPHPRELSTEEGRRLIADLGEMNVPVLLFSGGEPLLRDDLEELIEYARQQGIVVSLSSNGTLLDSDRVIRLKKLGVSYIGISLDGTESTHDRFRGQKGAYERTLAGIRNCRRLGQKVGLRFTMTAENRDEMGSILSLMEEENIPRLCLYHLVPQGRGLQLEDSLIAAENKRKLMDKLITRADEMAETGEEKEILTVANQADGAYLYLRLKEADDSRAESVYRYLKVNGGNRSGQAIACINWKGDVHPDQFSFAHSLGNIRHRSFADIWRDSPVELLQMMREREKHIEGRCSRCRWFEICRGSMRSRAESLAGDFWASDPGCYLKDEEVLAGE